MPTTEKADRSEEQRVKLGELREVLNTDVGRKAASQLFQGEKAAGVALGKGQLPPYNKGVYH